MIKKQRYTLSSTHVDSQGYRMMKSALDSMLPQLNGHRKPRLGLDHIRTFPPFGVIMNGEVHQGADEHYYLTADMVYFDKQEMVVLDDGSKLVMESFSDQGFPFIECEEPESDILCVATDPANFETHQEIKDMYESIKKEIGIEFDTNMFGRKSHASDPETVITITKVLAVALGLIKTKIPEKLGEAIGDDLVKFYKFVSSLVVKTLKKVKPSNRPSNFVIAYPNDHCNIELVITTHKADVVLNSLTREKLEVVEGKVQQLKKLDPEKIQFIYNEEDIWEFNFLLSKNGSVAGTVKSFNKRNELYNRILLEQENVDMENVEKA